MRCCIRSLAREARRDEPISASSSFTFAGSFPAAAALVLALPFAGCLLRDFFGSRSSYLHDKKSMLSPCARADFLHEVQSGRIPSHRSLRRRHVRHACYDRRVSRKHTDSAHAAIHGAGAGDGPDHVQSTALLSIKESTTRPNHRLAPRRSW